MFICRVVWYCVAANWFKEYRSINVNTRHVYMQGFTIAVVPVIGFCGEIDVTRLNVSPTEVMML